MKIPVWRDSQWDKDYIRAAIRLGLNDDEIYTPPKSQRKGWERLLYAAQEKSDRIEMYMLFGMIGPPFIMAIPACMWGAGVWPLFCKIVLSLLGAIWMAAWVVVGSWSGYLNRAPR